MEQLNRIAVAIARGRRFRQFQALRRLIAIATDPLVGDAVPTPNG